MSLQGLWNDLLSMQKPGTSDAEAARGAAADAQIQANQQQTIQNLTNSGDYTPDQIAVIQAQMNQDDSTQAETDLNTQTSQITQGFQEGLAQGYHNELNVVGGAVKGGSNILGDLLKKIFGNIPIWLYLLAAVAFFFYLGGGGWGTRKARRYFSK